jgi:hypothetical protein
MRQAGFAYATRARSLLWRFLLSLLCALHLAPKTAAAEPGPALRVVVAQDTCGEAPAIEARLRAHNPEQIFADPGAQAALTLHLAFAPRGKTIAGRLRLEVGTSPVEDVREIVGSSCAEVVEALVLVGLVLIEGATSSQSEAVAPAPTTAVAPDPVAAATTLEPAPADPALDAPHVRWLAAASGAFIVGQLPRGAGRAQLGPGLELVRGTAAVLMSVRLLGAFSYAGQVTVATTPSTFWSLGGRLELAGPRLAWRWLGAEAAGTFELGRLQGVAERAGADHTGHAQWLSLGGLVRASAGLSRLVRLELELGFFGRLRAAEFHFEQVDGSSAGVWRVPPWGFQTALGIALTIW